jgi:hypothetical protein
LLLVAIAGSAPIAHRCAAVQPKITFSGAHGRKTIGRLTDPRHRRYQDASITTSRITTMARKPGTRAEFALFDVLYEDGSQRSNRKVPSDILGGLDGDGPAREIIEEQDRQIAEKSGLPPPAIKSIYRSGQKPKSEPAPGMKARRDRA